LNNLPEEKWGLKRRSALEDYQESSRPVQKFEKEKLEDARAEESWRTEGVTWEARKEGEKSSQPLNGLFYFRGRSF
jgi:hypothetical protein